MPGGGQCGAARTATGAHDAGERTTADLERFFAERTAEGTTEVNSGYRDIMAHVHAQPDVRSPVPLLLLSLRAPTPAACACHRDVHTARRLICVHADIVHAVTCVHAAIGPIASA
jgi:hypothetical protein